MYASIMIACIALGLFVFLDDQLIGLYLNDTGSVGDIALALKYGKEYMLIMTSSLIPFAVCQAYVSTIRETGQTFVPMLASVIAVLTNLVLDYVLIFGLGSIPGYGVAGAATATVISRFVECIIVVGWTHRNTEKNCFIRGAYKSFRIPGNICKDILVKGTPLMLNEMF